MADTSFVSRVTNIVTAWAQAVNDLVYKGRSPLYASSTGSANAYVLTLPSGSLLSSLTGGEEFTFRANHTNDGAVTLQIVGASALTAKAVTAFGAALNGGELISGTLVKVAYNATADRFELLSHANAVSEMKVGNMGLEGSGINIGGVTYESTFKVSDINASNYAQTILHRHSTTLEPLIVGARSNSNTTGHTDVAANQNLFSVYGAGWAGSNYKLFGSIEVGVDATGTISNTSAPGRITFKVTPDGSTTAAAAITIANSKAVTFAGLQKLAASADIASAATVDLSTATGNVTRITGTTAVSAWTMNAGQWHMVIADGALPLTYHATTNKLNTGGSNYTCAAGDRVLLHKDNSGVIQASIIPLNTVFESAWIDYSATSTIVGWSSYTTKQIYYKDIGKTRFVTFVLYGTSNSTSVTFTLPSASSNDTQVNQYCRAIDNGTEGAAGTLNLPANSSTVTCYRTGLAAWTGSGTKLAAGQFTYQLP